MKEIKIERTQHPRPKPADAGDLPFGTVFTDHMLVVDYKTGEGWHDARIVPYGPIPMDPASTCFHYGQLVFEGLKAYRAKDDRVVMFRPEANMERMKNSCERLCIPTLDGAEATGAIARLIAEEREWIPTAEGTSLYVRPFIMATSPFLSVHPADEYKFITILSPVGAYYKGGLAPVRIYVEGNYVRAAKGGTGFAKCAGNYAASLRPQAEAEAQGYAQVLWLDGAERKYVEEVGTMNVFFVIGDEIVTPALNGSILPGITRDSVLKVLRGWNLKVSERQLPIAEVVDAYKTGRLREAFGAGTAAVISPIGELKYGETVMEIGGGRIGEVSQRVYDEITGIQRCERPDRYGWVYEVK